MQQNFFESVWVGFSVDGKPPFKMKVVYFDQDMPNFEIQSMSRAAFLGFISLPIEQQHCLLKFFLYRSYNRSKEYNITIVLACPEPLEIPVRIIPSESHLKIILEPPIE